MITVIEGYTVQDIANSIRDFLAKAAHSTDVRDLAVEITAGSTEPVYAIYQWIKDNVHYIPDPVNNEQFTSLIRLVKDYRSGKTIAEDCDSHAMLATALYRSIGINAHVVLADYTGNGWEHAYSQVYSDNLGNWIDIDTTSWQPFGWIVPYRKHMII